MGMPILMKCRHFNDNYADMTITRQFHFGGNCWLETIATKRLNHWPTITTITFRLYNVCKEYAFIYIRKLGSFVIVGWCQFKKRVYFDQLGRV